MAWALAAVPLLAAAFSIALPEPLPAPRLEPSFDQATAVTFAIDLARQFPDRTPGSEGASGAADWMVERFEDVGLNPQRDTFRADVPALGDTELVNILAVAPGATPETLVVMAHRDNSGISPGVNDNASGTAALLELARTVESSPPAHTIVFLSTDGGAFGGLGAERFAERPELLRRLLGTSGTPLGVVNLDSIASGADPRLLFAGDAARSTPATLLATAGASIERETGAQPRRPSGLAQLVDLAFPFALHEQGPFVARGIPAVTITTGGERPDSQGRDTVEALSRDQLGSLGRAAQDLLLRLDSSPELASATQSYLYVGNRLVRGWALQFFLLAALLPFLAAALDLFARCRRRHVALLPALRSLGSRLWVWLWVGAVFFLFSLAGFFPGGDARPINPNSSAAGEWPVVALVALGLLGGGAWLLVRGRLAPRGPVAREDELGGYLAVFLVLALVALVVAATNPYALVFLLPALHAWLWLPNVPRENVSLRVALYAAGFLGPLVLAGSFAVRLGLGIDAAWYVLALVSVGYVAPPLVLAVLVWAATAAQVGSLVARRYAPYPPPERRSGGGALRGAARGLVALARPRRAAEPETPHLRSVDEEG
jgi:Peptidase family M28